MTDPEDHGGLHIDSDWKSEAAREKERLIEQERAEAARKTAAGGTDTSNLFLELINLLAMQAAVSLGGYQGPGGERIPPNHAAGKHYIDLLEVLIQKTKGNLSADEEKMLSGVLHEMRMAYVQAVSGQAPPTPPEGQA
jgi:hypothetical protein